MEEIQPKPGKFGLTFGLILGGIGIVLALMLFSLEMHYKRGWEINLINFIITTSVIVLAISQFKKANQGFLSLGEAMKVGLGTAVVAGVVAILWNMVFTNFIEPDFMDKIFEISRDEMIEQNPTLTDEQIEQGEGMIRLFTGTGMIAVMLLVGSLFFGSIISLVAGLIMKKQKPEY